MLAPLSRIITWLEATAGFARIDRCYATDAMLLWDEAAQRYDAEITPTYGSQTLQGFYARGMRECLVGQGLGDQKVF